MNEPLISVIVPVYKTEPYLERCIASVLGQTYRNLEVILVDDGSPDNCPAMCDAVAHRDGRVKVIHQANGGLSSARNAALDICTGDYIAFVDSDDWLEPPAYEKMMHMMLEKDLDIVCCSANIVRNGLTEVEPRYYTNRTVISPDEFLKKILTDEIGSQVWFKLMSKRCWDSVRFPVGRLYEDISTTFLAVSRAERPVGFVGDEALYNYRDNNAGISRTGNPVKPYHIFLGFRDHYEYAKLHCPEIERVCLMHAASYAISTVFNYYSHRPEPLKGAVPDAETFLYENKERIKRCEGFLKTRKLALDVFYFSKPVFRALARLCDKVMKQA